MNSLRASLSSTFSEINSVTSVSKKISIFELFSTFSINFFAISSPVLSHEKKTFSSENQKIFSQFDLNLTHKISLKK